jgi:hypothetical protein
MRSYLINKNLCFYYWLRKKIGKKHALWVVNNIEKAILIFGREVMLSRGLEEGERFRLANVTLFDMEIPKCNERRAP